MSNKPVLIMSNIEDEPIVLPNKYRENSIVDDMFKSLKNIKNKNKYKVVPIGTDNDDV